MYILHHQSSDNNLFLFVAAIKFQSWWLKRNSRAWPIDEECFEVCASLCIQVLHPRTTFLLQPPTTNGKFKECLLCIQEQLKSFFFNSSFSGCTIGQTNAGLKKKLVVLNPTKLEMLTSVSSVCCVGDCGEGTDWVSEDKKLKWDRRRPKCWRTWDEEPTSCRPQGKLEKVKAASQKARREENENKMSTTTKNICPYQHQSPKFERCLFVAPLLIFNYGQPKPSKKEALITFLFPFWFGAW